MQDGNIRLDRTPDGRTGARDQADRLPLSHLPHMFRRDGQSFCDSFWTPPECQTQTLCTDMTPSPIALSERCHLAGVTRAQIVPAMSPWSVLLSLQETAPHNVLLRSLGWALSDGLGIRREYAQASTVTRGHGPKKFAPLSSLHFTFSRAPSPQTVGPRPLGLDPGIKQICTPASVLILGAGGARHIHHHHQHLLLPTTRTFFHPCTPGNKLSSAYYWTRCFLPPSPTVQCT